MTGFLVEEGTLDGEDLKKWPEQYNGEEKNGFCGKSPPKWSALSWGNAIILLRSMGFFSWLYSSQDLTPDVYHSCLTLQARKSLQFRVPQKRTCATWLLGCVRRQSLCVRKAEIYLMHLKCIKVRFLYQITLFTEQEESWACLDLSHMLTHSYPIESQNHSS